MFCYNLLSLLLFTEPNFYGYLLLSTFFYLDNEEVDREEACFCATA
jgi:hypothetical protein